jgi:hypothetical protein
MSKAMEDYWKDDFRPLQEAAAAVTAALQADEASPDADLYRRLATPTTSSSSSSSSSSSHTATTGGVAQGHAYHQAEPKPGSSSSNATSPQWKHKASRPLPALLVAALHTVQRTTYMGLLPATGWAYVTVDEHLYLVTLGGSSGTAEPKVLLSFTNPRKQSILACQIVAPRKGM